MKELRCKKFYNCNLNPLVLFVHWNNTLKTVNSYLNTNIYTYLETSGGQSSNLYLNAVNFLTQVLIRHLW
jgi:hypothetical protein